MQAIRQNTKPKANLRELAEVIAAYEAAAPKTLEEAEQTFTTILTTGPLLRKCYWDEVTLAKPWLLAKTFDGSPLRISFSAASLTA